MTQKHKQQKPKWVTFSSAQSSPMNQSLKSQFIVDQFKSRSKDNSSLASSQKLKLKYNHFGSVEQVIADIRQKKWEIQRLLVQQEQKNQQTHRSQVQIAAGLAKLRQVGRLMNIVCGIILGKEQKNRFPNDSYFTSDIPVQNPEYFYERTQIKYNLTPSNKRARASTFNQITKKRQNLTISILQNQSDNQMDANLHKLQSTIKRQHIQQNKNSDLSKIITKQVKQHKLGISHQYQINNSIPQLSSVVKQSPLSISQQCSVKILNTNKTTKKFKSIIKITLNLIRMCNRMLLKEEGSNKYQEIDQKLGQISSYFNECYSLKAEKCDRQFYENIKEKVQDCYENVYSRYQVLCT